MEVDNSTECPIVRISRGRFAADKCEEVLRLIGASSAVLIPAMRDLSGFLYYHAGGNVGINTVVNLNIWASEEDAKHMGKLPAMPTQCPILEAAGVEFDKITNCEPEWKIERVWAYREVEGPMHTLAIGK